jgi:predicted CoA-substrate-specific enzyme activase
MTPSSLSRIGIDIGALYLKAVKLSPAGRVEARFYQPHHGDPGKTLEAALAELKAESNTPIGVTGGAADLYAETLGVERLDLTRCQIEAVRRALPRARAIIDIGGASASWVELDEHGRFLGHATNSLCAAGTGSFLDEQAARLGISHTDAAAFEHIEEPPTIATRCSVFAKSDLIHRQQEGHSKAAMWSGLCRGMTRTLLGTLLNGRPLDRPTAIIGGVAQNREVMRWLKAVQPELLLVPDDPQLVAATGAAHLSRKPMLLPSGRGLARPVAGTDDGKHPWTLSLERSIYPSFETAECWTDADMNEIRLVDWPGERAEIAGFLGIDIGSTSTKLVLLDREDRVVVDIYRKTGGDPIGATKSLFRALRAVEQKKGVRLEVLGAGTTGSGRKLVGKVIGADAIVNEISAHVAGAVKTDPGVDTIFEIGGQDSKYMHVVDGHIRDSNMNYVCAAGTGSFVEEQAHKLGYPVQEVGRAVLGRRPPRTSDRCTVFMEQDVTRQVQSGSSAEDALAGVMVSVVKNYLNKVVGNRHYSREKIFFQGATARNPALVAAFERVLGVPIVVSPYCHVMGAYGVALITRQTMQERAETTSSFRGLDLDQREIAIRYDICRLCANDCKIAFADIQGVAESPSWGYMCGRDPDEQRVRVNPHERALRKRQSLWREAGRIDLPEDAPVVGLPQGLTTWSYLPLWRHFLGRLGYRVQLSGPTDARVRELGTRLSGADFCFPAKVAMGHAALLASQEGVDFVLVPHMVSVVPGEGTTAAKFCPYVQALPSYTRTALALNGLPDDRLLDPVVDLRLREPRLVHHLSASLSGPLGRSKRQIRDAWRAAMAVQERFLADCLDEGRKQLEAARQRGEKALVLLGRPYNMYDTGLNLGLPQKLAEQGRLVLPLDMLEVDTRDLGARYQNTFWSYGQRILAGAELVARTADLDAVYLTNFSCGPDSFLLTFAEEIFGNRPFLALELDEHGADAGYMTRIEAFFDVLKRPRPPARARLAHRPEPADQRDRIVWLPHMHPIATTAMAAAFRAHGYECHAVPPEDQEAFELGRALTRGSECLPTAVTIGSAIKAIQASGEPGRRHALFMPTAEGPCRFGQYCTLHRQVLDRAGLGDVAIMSPSSFNSYQGLSEPLRRYLWKALLAGDVLMKAACKRRPYELQAGETDRVLTLERKRLDATIERRGDIRTAIRAAVLRIQAVPHRPGKKPLVGIVGEIYVRCNAFSNEDVVRSIERYGGEAWLSPISEWIIYTAATQKLSFKDRSRNYLKKWLSQLKNQYIFWQERRMVAAAGSFLDDRHEPPIEQVIEHGLEYLPVEFEGEAILTLGRAILYARQGAQMVVNCAPFGCMPGTLTTAIFRKLAPELGIPVVGMFYDGHGNQNARLEVFLRNAVEQAHDSQPPELHDEPEITPEIRPTA